MYSEIEAKLKVDSLKEVENRLRQLGAEFVEEQYQNDVLFDDVNLTLTNSDKCLRLRSQKAKNKERFFLTYKGAKEKSNFKKRQEIDIEVADGDAMEKLLSALGYEKTISVEKSRSLWRFGGCEVALDNLRLLGEFVEIEGPSDEIISDVQKSLGLADLQHVPKSYASLIVEKLRSHVKK